MSKVYLQGFYCLIIKSDWIEKEASLIRLDFGPKLMSLCSLLNHSNIWGFIV